MSSSTWQQEDPPMSKVHVGCNVCGDMHPEYLCVYFSTVHAFDQRTLLLVCDRCEDKLHGDRWTLDAADMDEVEAGLISGPCDDA